MKISSYLLAGLLALVVGQPAFAQPSSDEAESRRVNTQNSGAGAEVLINQVDTSAFPKVNIFATVLRGGDPVDNLTASDFRVREDEVDQEPLTVVPKLQALNAVVTVDTSGSIKKALPDVQQAASGFIDTLGGEDRFTVIGFAREVKVLSSSGDKAQAKSAISGTVARGDTALFDAVYESVSKLKEVKGRKAVILLSDGVDDNGEGKQLSKHSIEDGLALARQVNVPVYTVGLGAEIDESTLKKIAADTGGKFYSAPKSSDLKQLYDNIGRQLLGQYSIQYTSNLPADGSVHRVKLSQASAFGTKEYLSPGTQQVATTTTTTTTEVVTKSATATVKEVAVAPPGLHVTTIPYEGAQPTSVEQYKLYPDDSQFEAPKVLAESKYQVMNWSTPVAPGKYILSTRKGRITQQDRIEVPAGGGLRHTVNLNSGVIQLAAKMNEEGSPVQVDRFVVLTSHSDGTEKIFDEAYSKDRFSIMVPAGMIRVRAKRGAAWAEKSVELKPGATVQENLVFNAGNLNLIATMMPGSEKLKIENFRVYTKGDGFTEPKLIDEAYAKDLWTVSLPAGIYVASARLGNVTMKKEVEVKSGGISNETIVLNGGMLEVITTQSKGGPRLKMNTVYVKKPGNGFDQPTNVDTSYSKDLYSTVLPPGEYLVGVTVQSGSQHEVKVVIEAGKKLQQEIVLSQQ